MSDPLFDSNWAYVAENGWKRLNSRATIYSLTKTDENGRKWVKIGQNRPKWAKIGFRKKNIFFDDPVFLSSSITSVRIVGDCRPFQKHIGQAISTTFRFDKVNWGYVPISFRRLKTAKNGRKRLKTAENVTSWDDLRPILDINFDNTGDENRLKSMHEVNGAETAIN